MLENHTLTKKYESLFNRFNVNTHLRLSHLFAQLQHESNLKPIEENLRYSAKRLLQVFPKYYKSLAEAQLYSSPSLIANRVYSNRMGNGDWNSGDGFLFRGRGFLQITGRNNYTALTKWANANGINVDYVANPDLLLNESDALISAFWYWSVNNCNYYADRDDVLAVSRIINLGSAKSKGTPNGMADRTIQLRKYKEIFKC